MSVPVKAKLIMHDYYNPPSQRQSWHGHREEKKDKNSSPYDKCFARWYKSSLSSSSSFFRLQVDFLKTKNLRVLSSRASKTKMPINHVLRSETSRVFKSWVNEWVNYERLRFGLPSVIFKIMYSYAGKKNKKKNKFITGARSDSNIKEKVIKWNGCNLK